MPMAISRARTQSCLSASTHILMDTDIHLAMVILESCLVIAKGFMSVGSHMGGCDHAPQPLRCCSLPILNAFIYREFKKVPQV